jgi:O-antigen biosynthesis protein
MLTLVSSGVDFKIAPPESFSIIGSNNIDTAGDLYMIDVNSISKSNNKRNKRLLDIGVSIVAIVFSPVLFFMQENKANYFLNCFNVLFGFYSWVGYGKIMDKSLPEIKRSVLSPSMLLDSDMDSNKMKLANLRYAKDYKIENDIVMIWKLRKNIGS